MGHFTINRRILESPDLQPAMNLTKKKKPKPTPSAATTPDHHLHPQSLIIPSSAIHNISHRFSKLYGADHKKLASISIKPTKSLLSHPQSETQFHDKIVAFSPVSDTSCTTLTKSKSHHGRYEFQVSKPAEKKVEPFRPKTDQLVKENGGSKKNSKKTPSLELEEVDVKRASHSSTRSLEKDQFERFQVGFEARRSSLSALPISDIGGRRMSFCNSQIELADFFTCNGVKVVAVDMPPFMQLHVVKLARKGHDSLEKFTSKILAFTLKREFDSAYGPAWHCIVGSSFGSFATHSVGGFMYFSMDRKIHILLFKTTVQKANNGHG